MAPKTHKQRQANNTPSAVCPECGDGQLKPVTRTEFVGKINGKFWVCQRGHVLPRTSAVVRVEPPVVVTAAKK